MATAEHLESLPLESHVRIVALTPELQRVPFYSATYFLHHSSTIELLVSLVHIKWSYLSFKALSMRDVVIGLMAAVARKFMHGRHANQYDLPADHA